MPPARQLLHCARFLTASSITSSDSSFKMLPSTLLAQLSVLLAVLSARPARAQSWIDCIDHSYDAVYTNSDAWVRDGEKTCEGYAHNYPGRGAEGFENDFTWKLTQTQLDNDEASLCQFKQSEADYSGWRQVIHAKPGDTIYLGYMPNGNVVKDLHGESSTWGVYWSGEPGVELTKPSEMTLEHRVDGKVKSFDDGNCGSAYAEGSQPTERAGDDKPCTGSVAIPSTANPGRYQMVWYWTLTKNVDEYSGEELPEPSRTAYTSCFDVVIDHDDAEEPTSAPTYVGTTNTKSKKPKLCGAAEDPTTGPPSNVQPELPVDDSSFDLPATVQPQPVDTADAIPPSDGSGDGEPSSTSPPLATTDSPLAMPAGADAVAPSADALGGPTDSPPSSPVANASTPALSDDTPTTPSSFTAPLAAVTYNGVGGTGLYGKVTGMQCPSGDSCTQTDFAVTGPIAPFDEDLTIALRGPLNIDDIAVFTSSDGDSWSHASSFSKQAGSSNNMAFLNNKGDPLQSGVFDMCSGKSQSFATSDGTTSAASATQFSGDLADGVEINVMSGASCADTNSCGVSRGVAYNGWKGNNKIFMVKARMPSAAGGEDVPAIWLLNGQIVRTAQYGCNCRGMGDQGKWKGGCGEFDVAEVLPGDVNSLTSTMYSFKGSRGTSAYAQRPFDDAVVFVVILTEKTTTGSTDLGMAQILMMHPGDVDLTSPPSSSQVAEWLQYRNGVQVDFDI